MKGKIKNLRLIGFQNHKNKIIHLFPTVNILIGDNDKGKSAITRALRWICLNDRRGKSFINKNKKECKVILDAYGHKITRTKGTKNTYKIDNQKSHRAIGTKVPEEVAKILNIDPISFQGQHNAHFLLSLTAGQASRELNKIISLDIIDRALAETSSRVKHSKNISDICKSRQLSAQERFDSLSWVSSLIPKITLVQRLFKVVALKRTKSGRLGIILQKAAKARVRADRLSNASLEALKGIRTIQAAIAAKTKMKEIKSMLSRLDELKNFADYEAPDMEWISKIMDKVIKEKFHVVDLGNIMEKIRENRRRTGGLEKEVTAIHKKIKKVSKNQCPLCGANI